MSYCKRATVYNEKWYNACGKYNYNLRPFHTDYKTREAHVCSMRRKNEAPFDKYTSSAMVHSTWSCIQRKRHRQYGYLNNDTHTWARWDDFGLGGTLPQSPLRESIPTVHIFSPMHNLILPTLRSCGCHWHRWIEHRSTRRRKSRNRRGQAES